MRAGEIGRAQLRLAQPPLNSERPDVFAQLLKPITRRTPMTATGLGRVALLVESACQSGLGSVYRRANRREEPVKRLMALLVGGLLLAMSTAALAVDVIGGSPPGCC